VNGTHIIPARRLLTDIAARNYMADLLVSFKQSRPFNKICLFQIIMDIAVIILSLGSLLNEKEQVYFDLLLTDEAGLTSQCNKKFDDGNQVYLIILIVVHLI
jgi:hypothetical protein